MASFHYPVVSFVVKTCESDLGTLFFEKSLETLYGYCLMFGDIDGIDDYESFYRHVRLGDVIYFKDSEGYIVVTSISDRVLPSPVIIEY